ncbi:MAG TPA: hypothetical protein VGS03_19620 [Candidatus Polarisedimenticolia bacterium]|jgi:hypothetical protein|nr:hypothetical protein [Candidatus Polarisedimenticolia bacterium]
MPTAGKPRQSRLLRLCAAGVVAAILAPAVRAEDTVQADSTVRIDGQVCAESSVPVASTDPAESLLASLHPDYRLFIASIRPLPEGEGARASVYMVLVRPGASDAMARASAPLAGQGARNDILYDPGVLRSDRSMAWRQLLLDHEYFHARHLAGSTSVPLPSRAGAGFERHYFEAAAWGWSVAQARAGRYPGLREAEFREALDRLGDHLRAMRPAGSYAAVTMPTSSLLPAVAAPLSAAGR